MKVLIGITPDTHDGKKLKVRSSSEQIVYLWDSYLNSVMDQGALAVVLPVTNDMKKIKGFVERLDGFVLAGGNFDVPAEYYGEKPKEWMGKIKPARSFFERALLLEAAKKDKPVLGICGGMQIINVAFGGSLYQDIVRERPGSREHQQKIKKTSPSHQIKVAPGTKLFKIMGGKGKGELKARVNSTHHQAVKDLGKDIVAGAVSADGLIEAVESARHRFIIGAQWHPELLYKKHPG